MGELLQLRGVVEAPPDLVAAVLLDVRPGGRSPLAVAAGKGDPQPGEPLRGGAGRDDEFEVTREGSRFTVTVDGAARTVTQHGEWWYHSVTSVEPDPRGSLVVHRVSNVADGHGWAVRFAARGPLLAAPGQFARHLRRLGELTGARSWLLET
jgi:hypothetical protein